MIELEIPQSLLDEYWNNIHKYFHDPEISPSTITHEKILEEILNTLNEYISNIADASISTTKVEYYDDKYGKFINELSKNFIKNYSPQESFEDNAYREYVILRRKYIVSETPHSIKKEDLLPRTKALYGIEFESIIVDTENANLICINNNRLYNNVLQIAVTTDINKLMEELPDWKIPEFFEYHTSGLNCHRYGDSDKRLEFASYALSPTEHKPSELFDTLEKMRDAFYGWTDEKYYLPDHGTISLLSDDKKIVYETLTGGTHMTISFPLTIHDNPVTWKYFMWLFIGLVTMYQPIYIALNGAPSSKTKGSERQRTSGSLVVGSAYMYNIFTPESGRYEFFINSPSRKWGTLPDYPDYAHWNDKDLNYRESGPWRDHTKVDIGNSSYTRSDSFKLIHNNSFITNDKETILYRNFYSNNPDDTQLYDNFIGNLASVTSNLLEFRFFDNEPTKDLLNKFNLLIRIADYAYEQSKNMEESVGIHGLSDFLEHQIDDKLNIRPLVNKKPWHDAVLESMNEGLDSTFNEEFIDECYEFLNLTQFSDFLENPELKRISAIDLNKEFVDEMNKAEHHFSEYFQTDNPTPDYSKQYQVQQLRISRHTAEDKKKVHEEEEARKLEEERQTKLKLDEERNKKVLEIIDENLQNLNQTNPELLDLIVEHIDKSELTNVIRYAIYERGHDAQDLIFNRENTIESSLRTEFGDSPNDIIEWFRKSLVPDLRQKEPKLKVREDDEDRRREQERERERQAQREREAIEQQINFIANIVTKNIEKITDEKLKDSILTTIHLRKISDTLRRTVYVDRATKQFMIVNCPGYIYSSLLDNIIWNRIPQEKQNSLIEWFRKSLIPDLESNIPELRERSQPQTTMMHTIPQNEDGRKSKIRTAIIETVGRLNERSQYDVITTISYTELTDILYKRIYEVQQSFDEIEELSELIIKDATPDNVTRTFEQENTVRAWFKVGLLSELRNVLLTENRMETRQNQPAHGNSEMVTLYAFSDYLEGLDELPEGFKLYRNIELAETQYYNEHPRSPNVSLYKINVASNDLSHHGNDMFVTIRPTSRVEIEKIEEPEPDFSDDQPEHIQLGDDERKIYDSIITSIQNVDNNAQLIIKNYVDIPKLVSEIYTRIRDDYSTDQIKGMVSLITQTSIFDASTIPENKKEIIDAWFVGFLIPQLIQDDILNPLQEEIPTTYATELEAVESEERKENETSIILDIIKLNIENLENPEMKDIVLKYILLNSLANQLHELIYILKYNTLELREHSLALLIQEGFFDELNEDYVTDPEVKSLLKTWLFDYLIPDLVKGTPLELGGLDVLFG